MSDGVTDAAAVFRDIALADAAACEVLSQAVGWPHRVEDWEMVITLGRGLVATRGDELVATGLWWPYGPAHAMVGTIIVSPTHQGYGLGRRLMDGLLAQAGSRSLMLNATEAGRPLYLRCGFVDCGSIRQHHGPVSAVTAPLLPGGTTLRSAVPADRATIVRLDQAATGVPRAALLDELHRLGDFVVLERAGVAIGFSALRRFGRGLVVGPVVAQDDQGAQALVGHWIHGREGDFMRVDTPASSPLSAWLGGCGLKALDPVTSMVRGTLPAPAGPFQLHALVSQALG